VIDVAISSVVLEVLVFRMFLCLGILSGVQYSIEQGSGRRNAREDGEDIY